MSEDALARIERNLAREQAARYLNEAGEVLVTVAATGVDCNRADDRLDVGRGTRAQPRAAQEAPAGGRPAARRSRARAACSTTSSARCGRWRSCPSCVKRRDVEQVQKDVEARQLLMRIRLMTRELEG